MFQMKKHAGLGFVLAACLMGVAFDTAAEDQTPGPPVIVMDDGSAGTRVDCMSTDLKGSFIVSDRVLALYDMQGNVGVLRLSGPCLRGMKPNNPWVGIVRDNTSDKLCHKHDFDDVVSAENSSVTCAVVAFEVVHLNHPAA